MTDFSNPIFIGGLSYSGKTQLRLSLAENPRLILTRRTFLWKDYYGKFGQLSSPENFERGLDILLVDKHIQALGLERERISKEYKRGPRTYGRLFGLLHDLHAEKLGKSRWGIQSGMVEYFTDQIFEAYPGAKIIHMVRDPIARIAESLAGSAPRPWKPGWEAAHWQHSTRLGLKNRQRHPDHYQIFSWESLRQDPLETLRVISAFIEEDPPARIRQDLFSETKKELPKPASAFVQSVLSKEIKAFGFPRQEFHFSFFENIARTTFAIPANLFGMLLWSVFGKPNRWKSFDQHLQKTDSELRWAR